MLAQALDSARQCKVDRAASTNVRRGPRHFPDGIAGWCDGHRVDSGVLPCPVIARPCRRCAPRHPTRRSAHGLAVAVVLAGLVAAPAYGAACSAKQWCHNPCRWSSSTRRKDAAAARRPTAGYPRRSPRTAPRAHGIALAFHVDYWDRLGWKDRFATPAFTERQYEEMRANRARFVYTPQVVVQGRDFPEWHGSRAVGRVGSGGTEARARRDHARGGARNEDRSRSRRRRGCRRAADRKGAVLYVALADDGLASDVKAGENAGAPSRARQCRPPVSRGPVAGRERRDALVAHAAGARRSREARRRSSRSFRTPAPATSCRRWRCR